MPAQEAVAVGACAAIEIGDVIGSTHRGHGHCGAIGNKYAEGEQARQDHWNRMMAELMGKETGYCNGRGGSMHIADVKNGNLGSTGIVGGNIPTAVGAALAEKYKKTGTVVLSFFGDGSTNTGSFHESMNMASVMKVADGRHRRKQPVRHERAVLRAIDRGGRLRGQHRKHRRTRRRLRRPGHDRRWQDIVAVFLAVKEAVEHARRKRV